MNTAITISKLDAFNEELKQNGIDIQLTQNEVDNFVASEGERGLNDKRPAYIHSLVKNDDKKTLIILKYIGNLQPHPFDDHGNSLWDTAQNHNKQMKTFLEKLLHHKIHDIVKGYWSDESEDIFETDPQSVNFQDAKGNPPFFLVDGGFACNNAKTLIMNDADIHMRGPQGITCLHLVMKERWHIGNDIINKGGDIYAVDFNGDSLLHAAIEKPVNNDRGIPAYFLRSFEFLKSIEFDSSKLSNKGINKSGNTALDIILLDPMFEQTIKSNIKLTDKSKERQKYKIEMIERENAKLEHFWSILLCLIKTDGIRLNSSLKDPHLCFHLAKFLKFKILDKKSEWNLYSQNRIREIYTFVHKQFYTE